MGSYRLGAPALLLTGVMLVAVFSGAHAARLDDAGTSAAAPAESSKIQLNFRDVDILNVIRLMSDLTGKNFLIDGNVRGRVTLIAPGTGKHRRGIPGFPVDP